MDYRDFLPDSDEALMLALGRVLSQPGVTVLVAERGGEVIGGIGLLLAPQLWNPEIIAMEELFWWVAPEAPNVTALCLLRAARRLAQECGVAQVTFKSLTSSPPAIDRVYRRMGLRPVETAYMGAP